MEGLLDFVLRDVLTRVGGIDRCVSEFIRVTGTLRATLSTSTTDEPIRQKQPQPLVEHTDSLAIVKVTPALSTNRGPVYSIRFAPLAYYLKLSSITPPK